MKIALPTIVAFIYAGQSGLHFYDSEYGFGLMWFAYAVANVGGILAIKGI